MCNIANRVKNYALKSCILLHRVPPTYKLEVSRLENSDDWDKLSAPIREKILKISFVNHYRLIMGSDDKSLGPKVNTFKQYLFLIFRKN